MKKSIILLLSIAALLLFSGCEEDTGSSKSFSDFALSSATYQDFNSTYSFLLYEGETSSEYIALCLYSDSEATPSSGTYILNGDYEDLSSGEAYLEYDYLAGTETYGRVAVSGTLTLSGSTVTFDNVTFSEVVVDISNYTYSYNGTLTDSGSFTLIGSP